ncbi:hypothetical protein NHQ30_005523 [Ciborinia camelliae]|nr:hypothetical protein NHQ30_005523 [Ciborinia camelliae]
MDVKERERERKERERGTGHGSIPRVAIQSPEQDEIVVFEEHDSPDERSHRRSRLGVHERARSTTRTIDTWERSEVGESTIFTPAPRNKSRGRSGLGERERDTKSPGLKERERELSVPRSIESWERSDVGASTTLTQRERERTKSRTPKSREARARSTTRTIDTWERSEVGASTVMSGPGHGGRAPRSGLGARDRERERERERSRVDRERERERSRVEKERDSGYEGEGERDRERAYGGRGYDGEGERWHGRGYEYKERGHSPVPSRLGESRRDRKMWSERGSGTSGAARGK